ncbi:hypothetical protein VNO77_39442 [Canavalia gladiata]|uniref:Uncharacterized protein n=1 Tax=Canavalia gladiata TaxID=3824 RepID=A0AAN9KED2_CANGL
MGAAATLLTGIPNSNPHTAARAVFSKQIWNISSKRHLAWSPTPIYTLLKQCDSDPFYGFPFSLIMVLKRPRLPARR